MPGMRSIYRNTSSKLLANANPIVALKRHSKTICFNNLSWAVLYYEHTSILNNSQFIAMLGSILCFYVALLCQQVWLTWPSNPATHHIKLTMFLHSLVNSFPQLWVCSGVWFQEAFLTLWTLVRSNIEMNSLCMTINNRFCMWRIFTKLTVECNSKMCSPNMFFQRVSIVWNMLALVTRIP